MESVTAEINPQILIPEAMAVAVNAHHAALLTIDGELETLPHDQAALRIHKNPVMLCHTPYIRSKINAEEVIAFDVLELFAFVHPATFCVPTPAGLCKALGLQPPSDFDDMPMTLIEITQALLKDLGTDPHKAKAPPEDIAAVMGQNGKGWPWTPFIFAALGKPYDPAIPVLSRKNLSVWKHLPEWAEDAPSPPPSHHGVTPEEAKDRLDKLLTMGNKTAESRPQQVQFMHTMTRAFDTPDQHGAPHIVLAEAGTGTGKTLGYLAPASVWSEKNDGSVWISTYTKNLQAQIDDELSRLYPDEQLKDQFVTIRKGRENYLCLLNFEDTAASASLAHSPRHAIAAGIMARWLVATKDGDLSGASFPGWLTGLLGYHQSAGLADRRGECVYSACDHYKKCFVEHSQRRTKHARIVVANHALVMIQAAMSAPGEEMPQRYIFDEGHHVFDAADSAFAAHLTARETGDLRRWILGAEGGKQSRARGLKRRAEDLVTGDPELEAILIDIVEHAKFLTSQGWSKRLKDGNPKGEVENFLAQVHKQILARTQNDNGFYSLETQTHPVDDSVSQHALLLKNKLTDLIKPMKALAVAFREKLNNDEGLLESDTRKRLDAIASSLESRAVMTLQAWSDMLDSVIEGKTMDEFVDWMQIERTGGRSVDLGLYRHFLDPVKPFAASLAPHAHGIGITSATLMDNTDEAYQDWEQVAKRTGSLYLNKNSNNILVPSPFDYAQKTKIFIVDDVNKNDRNQVASAYKTLFTASSGSALGLFTAIQRLKSIYDEIAAPLEEKNIPLYAQHIEDIDTGTLVDMFRDDLRSCLLGTDAIRDGVDVPGESLKLIVFDRVPWPRPSILHKARKKALGGRNYDEMLTRLKLKQAFGRLIRSQNDQGVFVMLDSGLPSRLHNAFPKDAEIIKCGLSEAAARIKEFLGTHE